MPSNNSTPNIEKAFTVKFKKESDMTMTEQILYWIEPEDRWRSRGYANNRILHVDYDNRTYKIEMAMICPKGKPNEIKITDKGNIKLYADYLKSQGFIEKKLNGSSTCADVMGVS